MLHQVIPPLSLDGLKLRTESEIVANGSGVPKETKDQEFRVGLSPSSIRVLSENGHTIFAETGAGDGAGF